MTLPMDSAVSLCGHQPWPGRYSLPALKHPSPGALGLPAWSLALLFLQDINEEQKGDVCSAQSTEIASLPWR